MPSGIHNVLHELIGVNPRKSAPALPNSLARTLGIIIFPRVLALMSQTHWFVDRHPKDLSIGMDIQWLTSLGDRPDQRGELTVSLRGVNVLWYGGCSLMAVSRSTRPQREASPAPTTFAGVRGARSSIILRISAGVCSRIEATHSRSLKKRLMSNAKASSVSFCLHQV